MKRIWITKISKNSNDFTKKELLTTLPKTLVTRAERYLNLESALSFITGRLLLKNALLQYGLPISLLEEVRYSEQGKPSLDALNFSISHSHEYVTLIFGTTFSVGIDIEKKKPVELHLFKYLFTGQEWKSICEAENSLERFYWFWVRKEALLKVVGCALKELKQLEVFEDHGVYKGKQYYFKSFEFDTGFNGVVAMEEKINFDIEFISLAELIASVD